MGTLSNPAAKNLFIQVSQPNQPTTGAIWSDSSVDNPALKTFDGQTWNEIMPVGTIIPHGGLLASIPAGYLLCNDQAVSRTTFANLFAVIGTAYGIGDGSTTYNVPDLRGKFPRGAENDQEVGSTGGEDTHVISTAELPAHSHAVTPNPHTHGIPKGTSSGFGIEPPDGSSTGSGVSNVVSTSLTSASVGSGTAHENKPAFQEVLYIIKT